MDTSKILPINIEAEMKKSFISYAMAVIINRALPDVRDGLKPVHRRTLFAMHELGFTPDKPFRKSVRIVGEVLGKYHPHGDSSVYEALVRMAQDFSMRYMLVEGHGNFGSIDGDGAAAMRYTEARMSKITLDMMQDIDKETVDFYPNFDNTQMQPAVLPARFPNLLVNGSSGIAVGMATNIPPHNLGEVVEGVMAMLDNPDIDIMDVMQMIKGPDFPTAGMILGQQGIYETYQTGRGRIIMRAKTEIEPHGNAFQIVVTELPYQVNKARLVEKIAELVHEKKVDGITGLRDESDRNGMRIVIELRRDVNPQVMLNALYMHTQLQDTFGVIMLALVDGQPKVLNLKEMLFHYIEHQKEVVVRRTKYDLEKAKAKAHLLEGLIIALDHIDEVIKLIRGSQSTAEAKEGLMKNFNLSERQAQAILDMRLQKLVGLERDKTEADYKETKALIDDLVDLLLKPRRVIDMIKKELSVIKDKYGDKRRTEIIPMEGEINLDDLIQEKDVVITLTRFGYAKRQVTDTYKSQHRGGRGISGLSTREEDVVTNIFVCSTHQEIMFFTNKGRIFKIKGYEIPEASRQAKGMAMVNLLQLSGEEKITAAFPIPKEVTDSYLVMATRNGIIKKTSVSEFENIRKGGLIAIVLKEGDELISVNLTDGAQELMIGTRNGMAIRFAESDIRPTGRATQGVKSVSLAEDDVMINMEVIQEGFEVLVISENGFGKRTKVSEYRLQGRGGKGVRNLMVTEKTGKVAGMTMINDEYDVMLMSNDGTMIRMDAATIRTQGRSTQGVTLMRTGESTVAGIAKVLKSEEDGEAGELTAPAENNDE